MMNKQLRVRLSKQLSRIVEEEIDLRELEKSIKKHSSNSNLAKLIFELIKPTAQSNSNKFIRPSFNIIKPLLVRDIKDQIKIMQREGWDESSEEIALSILDPSRYDEEIGDYADTTFRGYYSDLYDREPDLSILLQYEGNVIEYLKQEIKNSYKNLVTQVS